MLFSVAPFFFADCVKEHPELDITLEADFRSVIDAILDVRLLDPYAVNDKFMLYSVVDLYVYPSETNPDHKELLEPWRQILPEGVAVMKNGSLERLPFILELVDR